MQHAGLAYSERLDFSSESAASVLRVAGRLRWVARSGTGAFHSARGRRAGVLREIGLPGGLRGMDAAPEATGIAQRCEQGERRAAVFTPSPGKTYLAQRAGDQPHCPLRSVSLALSNEIC